MHPNPLEGLLGGRRNALYFYFISNTQYDLKVSCPAKVAAEMLDTLLLLFCVLFNCMNLHIHFVGHNTVKILQWQFVNLSFILEI